MASGGPDRLGIAYHTLSDMHHVIKILEEIIENIAPHEKSIRTNI
jgi:hypothetical protein